MLYKPQNIIEGHNIHVKLVKTSQELEIELDKLRPTEIIMDPNIGLQRVIKAKMHTISQKNSIEKYLHISFAEEENKAFYQLQI